LSVAFCATLGLRLTGCCIWGARRLADSRRRRASSSTLGSTAAAGVGAGRGFGRGFRGAVVPFAWPCRGRASAWAPRCRGGALPCGGALPGPGCRRAAPSAGGRRGAGAAPPAWRGGALPSAGGRGLDGCRRGAPFAAAARALARRAASWDIGGRGGCGALGLGAVDLAARRVSSAARLMVGSIGRSWLASSDAGTAAQAELRGASQSLGESATTSPS
jgi:hypothetical protein